LYDELNRTIEEPVGGLDQGLLGIAFLEWLRRGIRELVKVRS
jgi:hypothetical protein